MENAPSLSHFKIAPLTFVLAASEAIHLPEYKGAVLRGGFGHVFKRVVCALKNKECPECLLREKCAYAYIFETPPPPETRIMRKYPAAPHPFVLCPPLEDDRIYEKGEKIIFQLVLIGRAIEYLPYFIYTFEELGRAGLGKVRGKFVLEEVRAGAPNSGSGKEGEGKGVLYTAEEKTLRRSGLEPISAGNFCLSAPPAFGDIRLVFLTPVRLKFQGGLSSDLPFHVLFRNLLRRISLLSYFHCGKDLDADFRALIREAEKIVTHKENLRWHDWERYSTRQETKMKLGGLLGSIVYSGNFEPFWPYLLLGEVIHVGKGSSFGLGKFEILGKA